MSCSSAGLTSANHTPAALLSFPDRGRFWHITLSWLAGIAVRGQRRRQYPQPLELNDRLLADIGISGQHPVEHALKSSWIRVLMWHVHP